MISISLTTMMKTILVYWKFIKKNSFPLGRQSMPFDMTKTMNIKTAVQNPLPKLSSKKYVHQDDKKCIVAEVQSKKKKNLQCKSLV